MVNDVDAVVIEFSPKKVTVICEIHGEQEGCELLGDCLVCNKCMQELVENAS